MRRQGWSALGLAIAIGSVLWLTMVVLGDPDDLAILASLDSATLMGSAALLAASQVPPIAAFGLVARSAAPEATATAHSLRYATGNLARHLPGRVWGVAYQAAGHAPETAARVVASNVDSVIVFGAFNLTVAASLLLAVSLSLPAVGIAVAATGSVGTWWLLASGRLGLPRRLLGRVRFIARRPSLAAATARIEISGTDGLGVVLLLGVSWIPYLAAWSLLASGLGAGEGQAVALASQYTLAWLVGYASALTPSGLGVRELVFVGLSGVNPAVTVSLAIAVRLLLLSADFLLASVGLAVGRWTSRR